jgi:hypothetical protein
MLGLMCSYAQFLCYNVLEDEEDSIVLLSLVDSHFRTIPSLESIAVEIPDCEPYITWWIKSGIGSDGKFK